MYTKLVLALTTLLALSVTPTHASSYLQSNNVSDGSSRDWHWQLSDNYAAAMTDEKGKRYTSNHFGIMCGDGLEAGCNFALMRQNSTCPVASSHQLVFRFPKTRFSIDSVCVDSTDNTSIVLLPAEDNDAFVNFASLIRNESNVTVVYNADLNQISISEFSLLGSSKAIKTVSNTYMAGYIKRFTEQANQEIISELRAEFPEHQF